MKLLNDDLNEKAIVEIQLENFGIHTNTIITDIESLNSFQGSNGTGKTTVFEGAMIVLTGGAFPVERIKRGATSACITVKLNDGHVLKRFRTKSTQRTLVTLGKKTILDAAGVRDTADILEPITGVKSFRPFKGAKPVDMQYQKLDETGAFLVDKASPETILRTIYSLSPVGVVVFAKQSLVKQAASVSSKIKFHKEEKFKALAKIEALDTKDWNRLQARARKLKALTKEHLPLLQESIERLEGCLTRWDSKTEKESHSKTLVDAAATAQRHYGGLKLIKTDISKVKAATRQTKVVLEKRKQKLQAEEAHATAKQRICTEDCNKCKRTVMTVNSGG